MVGNLVKERINLRDGSGGETFGTETCGGGIRDHCHMHSYLYVASLRDTGH